MKRWMLKKIFVLFLAAGGCFCPLRAEAEPISLSVMDGDVRSVLLSTARMGGFNLVLDDSVAGTVTVSLQNVEPLDAMHLVASAGNLLLEQVGGNYVVTARGNQAGLSSAHVFPLRYADPEEVRNSVILSLGLAGNPAQTANKNSGAKERKSGDAQEDGAASNGRERRVSIDYSTNSLIVYGTPEEAFQAGRLLQVLDVPAKQVSLEARVVSIDKSAAKELGVEWAWSAIPQYPDVSTSYRTHSTVIENPDGSTTVRRVEVPEIDVERSGQTSGTQGIIRFGRGPEGYPFEFYYGAKLNAMVADGKAQILSRPNITTLQGHEAVINIGGEVPVPKVSVTNSTTVTSIDYREAGIILRYTPRVNADGHITAQVHTEVSSPVFVDDIKAYRFRKRSADTTVRLRDGETMVIGGLIGSEESRTMSKIPFLGDLPILGSFFRSVKNSKTDSEIMIFLTARILDEKA